MRRVRVPHPLPAVGRLLNQPEYAGLSARFPRHLVAEALRTQLAQERTGVPIEGAERLARVSQALEELRRPRLRRVINATGVILHTNLGRAPLSGAAAAAAAAAGRSYSNLEVDLGSGRRGERASVVEPLLQALTGAEAALVVNNNAAAVLLALTALCARREVVVSRGQQVEIGGAFRMPDVMRLSGARMIEVGTTNRTRIADYEEACGPRTAALLRVHTSNFQVTGFTESASLQDMSALAARRGLLLIDDIGSGALDDVAGEPAAGDSVRLADIVLFSGDKLLGGPQAGIAVGRAAAVRRLARHPLARALRVDKMTLAALEVTLRERLLGEGRPPVAAMLGARLPDLRRRAGFWMVKLQDRGVRSRLLDGDSAAGGGSLPGHPLPTVLVAIEGPASRLTAALRTGTPAVMARVEGGLCCLDPRTVLSGEDEMLLDAVEAASRSVAR